MPEGPIRRQDLLVIDALDVVLDLCGRHHGPRRPLQSLAAELDGDRDRRVLDRREPAAIRRDRRIIHVRLHEVEHQEGGPGLRPEPVQPHLHRLVRRAKRLVCGPLPVVGVEAGLQPELWRQEGVVHDGERRVALATERARQGGDARVEVTEARAVHRIAPDPVLVRELPGQQAREGRQRPTRVSVRAAEDEAIGSEGVDLRRSRPVVAVDAEAVGAQRVHDDEDDVGWARGGGLGRVGRAAAGCEQKPHARSLRPGRRYRTSKGYATRYSRGSLSRAAGSELVSTLWMWKAYSPAGSFSRVTMR